jgi:hypothetical protein
MNDERACPWVLTLENDERVQVEQRRLTAGPYVIGRDPACDVRVNERNVSRRHAELARDDEGGWWVRDLGARYGSFLNGRRLGERAHPVAPGDCVQVGEMLLTVRPETFVAPAVSAFATLPPGQALTASATWPPASRRPAGEHPARLLVVHGPQAGRAVRLDRGPVTLGGRPEANAPLEGAPYAGVALVVRPLAGGGHEIVNRGTGRLLLGLQPVPYAPLGDGDLLFLEDDAGEVLLKLRYLGEGKHEPSLPGMPLPLLLGAFDDAAIGAITVDLGAGPDAGGSTSPVPPAAGEAPRSTSPRQTTDALPERSTAASPPAGALPERSTAASPPVGAPIDGSTFTLAPPDEVPERTFAFRSLAGVETLESTAAPAPEIDASRVFETTTDEPGPPETAPPSLRGVDRRRGRGALAYVLGGTLLVGLLGFGLWRASGGASDEGGAGGAPAAAARPGFEAWSSEGGRGGTAPDDGGSAGAAAAGGGAQATARSEAGASGRRATTARTAARVGAGGAGDEGGGPTWHRGESDEAIRARLEQRVFGGRAKAGEVDQLREACSRLRDRACTERLQTLLANGGPRL